MDNEILQQICNMQEKILSKVDSIEHEQEKILSKVDSIEHEQKRLAMLVENDVRRDIRIIAENHLSLNQKLDDLRGLNEKVIALQEDTSILKSITKDTLFDLKVLKHAK